MRGIERGGIYYRVCDPTWKNPLDTDYAKRAGGRWNPPGEFGALYLNATIAVAAANARRNFEGEIATLYDLQPEQRPDLVTVDVGEALFVDVVTPQGIRSLRLPASFPESVSHERCHVIGRRAYESRRFNGIAYRSNAEATATSFVGEELAVFDRSTALVRKRRRSAFARWYPTEREGPSGPQAM
ncbi:MAG TPA: RES domain-containing protein [Candidatus Baltobacteraceae bacterium]|nr:RES domain-containing protein [Candidatus Baltobacteraceae bacterium]